MLKISNLSSKALSLLTFVSSILIVYFHSFNLQDYFVEADISVQYKVTAFVEHIISQGIGSSAVYVFFFVSGFLYFFSYDFTFIEYMERLKKKVSTLMIPYLLWNIIYFFIYFISSFIPGIKQVLPFDFNGINVKFIFEAIFLYKCNYSMWFIFNLIILMVLTFFFAKLLKRRKFSLLVIGILLAIWVVYPVNLLGVLRLDSVVFFLLGGYIAIYHKNIFEKSMSSINLCLLSACWLIFLCLNGSSTVAMYWRLIAVLGFVVLIELCKKISQCITKLPPFIYCTFIIYALHPFILSVLKKIVETVFTFSFVPLLSYFILPCLTVALCLSLGIFMNKYIPVVYKVLTGGRTKK